MGAPNHCGGRRNLPKMSHSLSSIQRICSRKTLGSNMGVANLLLAPGAIYPRYAPATDVRFFKPAAAAEAFCNCFKFTFVADNFKHLACPQWPGFVAGSATFRPGTTFGQKLEVREIGQSDSIFHWSKELPGRKPCQDWNFPLSRQHFAKVQGSPQLRPVWTVHGRNSGTCVFGISLSDDIWREITVCFSIHRQLVLKEK